MATTDTDKKSLMDELTAEERKFVLQQRLIQILANVRAPFSRRAALRRARPLFRLLRPAPCALGSPPRRFVRTLYLRSALSALRSLQSAPSAPFAASFCAPVRLRSACSA